MEKYLVGVVGTIDFDLTAEGEEYLEDLIAEMEEY